MSRIHANNFGTKIHGSITNVSTSIVLTSVTGFPSIGAGVTCNLTLQSGSNIEIVTATARSSNTLTVTRAAEGTTAQSWADGTSISIRPTADSVDRKLDVADATETAQDAVGAMVDSTLVYTDATPLLSRAALTGDVTASEGSNTTTIANNAVTLAKMATMATASILGRNTSGTGNPEVLSASTTKSLLSLNNVENTALSTWVGTSNITTLGTIGTGTWQATTITVTYGGTGRASATAYAPIFGGTTSTGAHQSGTAGTSGQLLQSGGSSAIAGWTTATYPTTASTAGKRLKSDGTNLVMSTTTMPDSGTSRKMIVGDGTNYVESTETWAVPGSSGNYLKSDGTNWTSAAFPFASQSDQETGSSNTVTVTPGVQQYHPSAAKWWANINGAGTSIIVSYNVTSITDGGTGILTVSIGTDFSSANWVSFGQAYDNVVSTHVQAISLTAGTVNYNAIATASGALRDPSISYLVGGFGDQ